VLQGDFHVHTRFSDGFLSPIDVLRCAERQGLDVIGLTEHNNTLPGLVAKAYASLVGGPIVIVGEEVTSREFHLIALGLERSVSGRLPLGEAIQEVHRQGGLAIAAHPVHMFWDIFRAHEQQLDGAEVMHPIAFRSTEYEERGPRAAFGWRWEDLVEYYQGVEGRGHHIAAIGSSDYHFFKAIGACRTFVFVDQATDRGVLQAIKAGRTVVQDLRGKRYGDAAMIALLEAEPLPPPSEPSYEARSGIDAIGRTLALLGLAGLVLVGWPAMDRLKQSAAPREPVDS
jgi:hypothetical protein